MTASRSGRSSRRVPVASVLGALLVAVSLVAGCSGDDDTTTAMPPVTLESLADGTAMQADEIEGPALVNLWATWCAPCRAEMPAFQDVADELGDQVRIVGVNEGDDGGAAETFVDEIGVTFPQYLDRDGALLDELRIAGLPATIALDASGNVVSVHSGTIDAAGIRELAADVSGG